MVEATPDRDGPHAATRRRRRWSFPRGDRYLLRQALMRSVVVEVAHVLAEDVPQLGLAQDQEVIETLAPHTAEEALTGGVPARRPVCRPQCRDAGRRRDTGERLTVLAIVVAKQIPGAVGARRGLAPLLGDPGIGRVPRHADVDHAARAARDDEAGEDRAEEAVGDGQEVAGPDRVSVVAQERRPGLPRTSRRAGVAPVPLDGRRGDADTDLEEFAPDTLPASSGIRAIVSGARGGRWAGAAARDRRRQDQRNSWRCQRSSVAGWTISSADRHARMRLARSTSSARSAGVQRGRLTVRRRMASWWRRSAFAATSAGLLRATSPSAAQARGAIVGRVAASRRWRRPCAAARPSASRRCSRRIAIDTALLRGRQYTGRRGLSPQSRAADSTLQPQELQHRMSV